MHHQRRLRYALGRRRWAALAAMGTMGRVFACGSVDRYRHDAADAGSILSRTLCLNQLGTAAHAM